MNRLKSVKELEISKLKNKRERQNEKEKEKDNGKLRQNKTNVVSYMN